LTPVTIPVATVAWVRLTRQFPRRENAAWYIAATMVMLEGLAIAFVPVGAHLVDQSTSFNDSDWTGGLFLLGVAGLCVIATAGLAAAFVGVASQGVRRAA
jgi:hypothetical protein